MTGLHISSAGQWAASLIGGIILLVFFCKKFKKDGLKTAGIISILIIIERVVSYFLTYVIALQVVLSCGVWWGFVVLVCFYISTALLLLLAYDFNKIPIFSKSEKNFGISYLKNPPNWLVIIILGMHSIFFTAIYVRRYQKNIFSYDEMSNKVLLTLFVGSAVGCILYTFAILGLINTGMSWATTAFVVLRKYYGTP
jgi:hypothetical protein